MPNATRFNDNCTGHDDCPAVPLETGSDNVFINGMKAGRQGDSYAVHGCVVHPPHNDTITGGSGTVFINDIPAARVGDSVQIGGSVEEGSPNVKVGD